MSEGIGGGGSEYMLDAGNSSIEQERTEVRRHTPEQLKPDTCLVDFILYPPRVDSSGIQATAAGVIKCEATDCFFNGGRVIDGNAEGDNACQAAAGKVITRARRQMAHECLDWISTLGNVGKPIPDDRLPAGLRRNPIPFIVPTGE